MCCCTVLHCVTELMNTYFHYLSIFNFHIYCSEEWDSHLMNSSGKRRTRSWLVRVPACLWEEPKLHQTCSVGQGKIYPFYFFSLLCNVYFSLWTPGNSTELCFQLLVMSVTWLLLPNCQSNWSLKLFFLPFDSSDTNFVCTLCICLNTRYTYTESI